MQKLKALNWEKLSWIAAVELAAVMVILTFILPGGMDVIVYYQPFANGCLDCGFIPYFAQILLFPLSLVPPTFAWPLWMLISLTGLLLVARETRINPVIFLLTFPMIGQFWLGQVDVFLCVGVLLAIRSKNPYLRGLGITLMMVKPQIAVLAVLFLLVREDRKQLLRVLAIPAGVLAVSLVVYGFDWPLEWFANAQNSIPDHVWKMASAFFWPWGLFLIPLPFLFKDREEGTIVSYLVSSLSMPFFSVYSYIVFLILESPWWVLPLSYAYRLFYPKYGLDMMKMAWLLPLTMLLVHLGRRFEVWEKLNRMLQKTQ